MTDLVQLLTHIEGACSIYVHQEPLKLWTELYTEFSPNGGLELVVSVKSFGGSWLDLAI